MVVAPLKRKRTNYIKQLKYNKKIEPIINVKNITKRKSKIFNSYVNFLKYINTGSDLSLTHIYNIKKYDINEIFDNNNQNIGIDFLHIYIKLLELDTSDIFNIKYDKYKYSSTKSSNSRKLKRQKKGGAISFNYNNIIKGFLENQFIFDNKHDFGILVKDKDFLYSNEDIKNSDLAILNILKNLFTKDERTIFFNLIQQNIKITQNILYINLNEIEKKQALDIITNANSITTNATSTSQNVIDYLQQILNISNVKYMTDGKLNIKNDKQDKSKSSDIYNNIVTNINKYLTDNNIYTLENCYDSLSIKINEAYLFFNSPDFINSIEIFAYITALVFDHSINNLPPNVPIDIFKAFNKKTSKLFNVVYYKYKKNITDTNYTYQTALIFKKTSFITELLTTIDKQPSYFNLIILKKKQNKYVYSKTDNITNTSFYGFDLIDIKNFNSIQNIITCINKILKDINTNTIQTFTQNYKRLLARPNNMNNNITFILLYIYNYYSSFTALTPIQKNKKISYILFDLKKAGDMCKILVTFYYSYIINNSGDPTLTTIITNYPNSITSIKNIIKSTIAFSSNDKLAALNSIFKQSNNVFFGDGKTKTLYIYNNDNDNFNMNIIYLWLNKYLCLDNFNLKYDIIEELNLNINNPDFQEIFTKINNALSITNSKSITENINRIVYPLYTTQKMAEINFKEGILSRVEINNYNIYIRVLFLTYLNKIKGIITENLRNNDNNMIFSKNMFEPQIFKQTSYKTIIDKIINKLFNQINDIITDIIDKIINTIIIDININFTNSEHLYLSLTIINNILMIINVFLFCFNKNIQIITEINNIKKNISDLFAKKYSYECIKTEFKNEQQISTTLSSCITKKIENYRITEKRQKKQTKKAQPTIQPDDITTLTTAEISSYINNYITKIDIINYIMIFNKYYEYFNKLSEYIQTNNILNINNDSINKLIDKIKIIYYYIYIQIYIKNKEIIPNIQLTTTIKDFHTQLLSSIIDELTLKVITTINNNTVFVKGIQGETEAEKEEREKIEKNKIKEIQEGIINGIKSKIDILKDNIQTLEIFNYKNNYNINSLSKITLLSSELETINELEFVMINQIIDSNIKIEFTNRYLIFKILRIYNFLIFDIEPPQDKKDSSSFDVII